MDYAPEKLSRRERQIMDILFERGEASALEVQELMADAPGYSAVRTMLRLLEEKGQLSHRTSGRKYIYKPAVSRATARKSAMRKLLSTFYENSTELAMVSLLDVQGKKMSDAEYDRLSELIAEARKR
ncbi:MAG: BlaI/MecI/CopY family transcriptional regulator [Verrucomicrobia bacterium]|nr:BlaI/MecI/CopY family transcriptional regulator [Verrucomicrobiota bacterium]